MKKYFNFDLEISKYNNAYLARVISSPEGEGRSTFTFPFKTDQLNNYLHCFSNTRGVALPSITNTPSFDDAPLMIEAFGSALFDTIFQKDVGNLFRVCLKTVQDKQVGLRLRLRLTDVPELINIPWEYLFDSQTNTYLSLSNQISIVRYMELPSAIRSLSVSATLNILIVISNPNDSPLLDVLLEKKKMDEALGKLANSGNIRIKYIHQATITNLTGILKTNDFHILHFIGHGYFDKKTQEGSLFFERPDKKGQHISGKYLATIIQNQLSLRLVVLNNCEGGITSSNNIFSGVAQALVKKGIPAVVAMQYDITDQAAIVFAEQLYTGLANSQSIDTALNQARTGIYYLPNECEFGTAALYMRAEKGRLFAPSSQTKGKTYKVLPLTDQLKMACTVVSCILLLSSLGIAYGVYQWIMLWAI